MAASRLPKTYRALAPAVFAILSISCAGAARHPRSRGASAHPANAPAIPPDPLAASGVLRAPSGGVPVRVLGAATQDGGVVLHAACTTSDDEDAVRRATLLFTWARPFLHERRIHTLRVVIHTLSGPRSWRFGLDVVHGWRRRDEAIRDTDRQAGPFPPAEIDAIDEVDARGAAEAWLAVVDASSYDEALEIAPRLAARGSRSAWTSYLRAVPALQEARRAPFVFHAERLDDLPGGPFVLLAYVTKTASGGLLETVAVERGPTGWRVASYDAHELGWSDLQLDIGLT